jgi:hypothetical protein
MHGSRDEVAALDAAIGAYARQNGLSETSFEWLFNTRGGVPGDAGNGGRLQRVWYDLAAATPHRSPKQVWAHATRRLHEAKGQGRWTADETEQLAGCVVLRRHSARLCMSVLSLCSHILSSICHHPSSLVAQYGTRWTDVGAALGRAPEECKDKWRAVRHGPAVARGPWSQAEIAQLYQLVATFQAEEPVPGSGRAVRAWFVRLDMHAAWLLTPLYPCHPPVCVH